MKPRKKNKAIDAIDLLAQAVVDGHLVFRFRKPSGMAIMRLRRLLAKIPVVPSGEKVMMFRKPNHVGALDGTVAWLKKLLKTDYTENEKARLQGSWVFEYQVANVKAYPHLVGVFTRMYHPTKGGNIYYGRAIARIPTKQYAVWADD